MTSVRLADGRQVTLTTVDLLSASPERLKWTRNALLAVQSAVYRSATHHESATMDAADRVERYVDDAVNITRYSIFNTAVIFSFAGEPVGCTHGFVERVEAAGKPIEVVRMGANLCRAFRGARLVSTGYTRLALAFVRRHPFAGCPRYYLGHCMTPLMYTFICHRAHAVYPGIRPTSDAMAGHYRALVGAEMPAPVAESVASDVDPATARRLAATTDPHARFFIDQNPDFAAGYALPVLVRINTGDYVLAMVRTAWRARRRVR